jgi:hypothetical protein
MPKDELLPGVTTADCPPAVVCDARAAIRKARRRALARDVAQIAVLVAVDYLFLRWPEARVPLLDRHQSLRVVEATNAVVAVHLWFTRFLMPKWSAWRAASTWSRAEREKFTR